MVYNLCETRWIVRHDFYKELYVYIVFTLENIEHNDTNRDTSRLWENTNNVPQTERRIEILQKFIINR